MACSDSTSGGGADQGVDAAMANGDGSSTVDLATPAVDLYGVDFYGVDFAGADLSNALTVDGGGTLTCHAYELCVNACMDAVCTTGCYANATDHTKMLLQTIADCEYFDCFNGVNPQCMPSERVQPTTIMCMACEKFARMFGRGKCPMEFQACDNDL